MSVIMILRVKGDPDGFERYANSSPGVTEMIGRIGAAGQAAGAIRHTFAGGDGEILVVDEWPDADTFQQFFQSQPEIPQLMQDGGAQGAPQISFYRKLDTHDSF